MTGQKEQSPEEVRLQEETLLHIKMLMKEAVKDGLSEFIKELTTDEAVEKAAQKFWGSGLKVIQTQAQQQAGKVILGGLWGLGKRAIVFLFLGMLMYSVGGWTLLTSFTKMFTSAAQSGP